MLSNTNVQFFMYSISLKNSRPSINRIGIIDPPPTHRPSRCLLPPPCQIEVQCDPAKLISHNSNSEN